MVNGFIFFNGDVDIKPCIYGIVISNESIHLIHVGTEICLAIPGYRRSPPSEE